MALSPNIPTSFVPKQPVQTSHRPQSSGLNVFGLVSLFIFVVTLAGAGGVFLYEKYLGTVLTAKEAQIEEVQGKTNQAAVKQFIRMRDRFSVAHQLMNDHTTLSNFFEVLEQNTVQNVRFDSLILSVDEEGAATIEMSGVARNFNALASQSSVFAKESRVRNALFSNIDVTQSGNVMFSFTGDVPSEVIRMETPVVSAEPALPAIPTGTTTPVTATSTPAATSSIPTL